MRRIIPLLLLILSLVIVPVNATVNVVRYPSGTSVQVCQPSDTDATCGGGTASIAQSSHGLAVADIVRYNGTNYVKSEADNAADAEVIGIVASVTDSNNFVIITSGLVTGLSGLTAGNVYYLSAITPGLLTSTAPTTSGTVSKPILLAVSTTSGYFINMRGMINASAGPSGGLSSPHSVTCALSGGNSVIQAGKEAVTTVPYDCTINQADLTSSNQISGSIVVDVWKGTFADYVAGTVGAGDSIVGSNPPTLSSQRASQDTTLTGWTTHINAGDKIICHVNSTATLVQDVNLTLRCTEE